MTQPTRVSAAASAIAVRVNASATDREGDEGLAREPHSPGCVAPYTSSKVRCETCLTVLEVRCGRCFRLARQMSGHNPGFGCRDKPPVLVGQLPRRASEAITEDPHPRLVTEMQRIIKELGSYALAAPQIGVFQRFTVLGEEMAKLAGTDVLLNPAIISRLEEVEVEEACLSLFGYEGNLMRASGVVARVGLVADRRDIEAAGIFAQVLQHETDHMAGVLYIDRLKYSDLRRTGDASPRLPTEVVRRPVLQSLGL